MACPDKYKEMNSFYKYYSGEKVAPVLTIFIGGNHEASNYMQELFYGGYVARNIYYIGCAGVINVGGLRICGMSGIYNQYHYENPVGSRYEHPPYTPSSQRSVYHVRPLQVMQLKMISEKVDVFLSHDWPRGICSHGDVNKLLSQKKFLRQEINENSLGSPASEELLHALKPSYWFCGHMHVKFPAIVQHDTSQTKFLALDKCLPGRSFMQFLDDIGGNHDMTIYHDKEWLAILHSTQQYVAHKTKDLPSVEFFTGMLETSREIVASLFPSLESLRIEDDSSARTAQPYVPVGTRKYRFKGCYPPMQHGNLQTDILLSKLGLYHVAPVTIPLSQPDDNEIDIGI